MKSAQKVMATSFIETRLVQDPSMSDAEYFHQRQSRSGPNVGKIKAEVNMLGLIGGFARFKKRSGAQEEAAAMFRKIYDRAQIGGARAVDYAAVKVDTSGPPASTAGEIGENARGDYADAVRFLGMIKSSLIERVIVHDVPISKIAGMGARARARTTQELYDALDDLAVHFKLAKKRSA